ncbi:MAG: 16S rRNA (guanine(527)-N(7))-methyltransferase RsmG [Planctomycetota bacterium]
MIDSEFETALADFGLDLDEALAAKLQHYAQTMWRFNEQLNLTRHTTWDLFVARDLRDCLQLAMLLQPGEEVLDLGSGNGVPGIPLAILRPDVDIALAESVGKRAKVLDELVTELALPVPVYAARGEDLLDDFRFTTIVSRAVGSLAKFCTWIQPHWSQVDRLLLVKGPRWVTERGEARHLGLLKQVELRVAASYPLGSTPAQDENPLSQTSVTDTAGKIESLESEAGGVPEHGDPGQGVILQLKPKRPLK